MCVCIHKHESEHFYHFIIIFCNLLTVNGFLTKCCNWIGFLIEMRNIERNGKKKEEKRNSVGLLKSMKNKSLLMSVWFSAL